MLICAERSVPKNPERDIPLVPKPKYMSKGAYVDTPLEVIQDEPSDDSLLVVARHNPAACSNVSSS